MRTAALFTPAESGLVRVSDHWYRAKSCDVNVVPLFQRHYSCPKPKDTHYTSGIAGPGEDMTLITATGDALFVWRSEEFRKDDQWGVECSVFRNEGSVQSSLMIREAVEAAVVKWKPQRFFTFVNAEKVQSANPGYCFKMAGWSFCGFTKAGLHILEYRN